MIILPFMIFKILLCVRKKLLFFSILRKQRSIQCIFTFLLLQMLLSIILILGLPDNPLQLHVPGITLWKRLSCCCKSHRDSLLLMTPSALSQREHREQYTSSILLRALRSIPAQTGDDVCIRMVFEATVSSQKVVRSWHKSPRGRLS